MRVNEQDRMRTIDFSEVEIEKTIELMKADGYRATDGPAMVNYIYLEKVPSEKSPGGDYYTLATRRFYARANRVLRRRGFHHSQFAPGELKPGEIY